MKRKILFTCCAIFMLAISVFARADLVQNWWKSWNNDVRCHNTLWFITGGSEDGCDRHMWTCYNVNDGTIAWTGGELYCSPERG